MVSPVHGDYRRCQAEIPLIILCRFPGPALIVVDRGLDDELKGTAYAVVDGVDGRSHHIKLPDLDAAGDSSPGSIVELRKFDDAQGRRRVAIAVRSDLSIQDQVTATGATWLDRQAAARDPVALGQAGFGAEVREAMNRRADRERSDGIFASQRTGMRRFEVSGAGRLMPIVVETEQIADRRNFPLNSRAQFSDGSARRFFVVRRKNLRR